MIKLLHSPLLLLILQLWLLGDLDLLLTFLTLRFIVETELLLVPS